MKNNVIQILEPMHTNIVNLVFCARSFFSHNRQIYFQSISVVVKIWQIIKVRVLKPKFNDCHLFVNKQQKSMDIEHVFNMYNQIIVYFKDIHAYCDHRIIMRWVKLRSLCIQKICRGN